MLLKGRLMVGGIVSCGVSKTKRAEKNQEKCENKAISWIKWLWLEGNCACYVYGLMWRLSYFLIILPHVSFNVKWIYTHSLDAAALRIVEDVRILSKITFPREIRGWNEWCSFIGCVNGWHIKSGKDRSISWEIEHEEEIIDTWEILPSDLLIQSFFFILVCWEFVKAMKWNLLQIIIKICFFFSYSREMCDHKSYLSSLTSNREWPSWNVLMRGWFWTDFCY